MPEETWFDSRQAPGSTQLPVRLRGPPFFLFTGFWEGGDGFTGIKRLGREDDHSQPSSTEVKNTWRCAFTLSHAFMAWCFVKHRDDLYQVSISCSGLLEIVPLPEGCCKCFTVNINILLNCAKWAQFYAPRFEHLRSLTVVLRPAIAWSGFWESSRQFFTSLCLKFILFWQCVLVIWLFFLALRCSSCQFCDVDAHPAVRSEAVSCLLRHICVHYLCQ